MVEWGFETLYSRMRAMILHAGLHKKLDTGLWPKYASTATKLDFYGKMTDFAKHLRNFEGVVRSIANVKAKMVHTTC